MFDVDEKHFWSEDWSLREWKTYDQVAECWISTTEYANSNDLKLLKHFVSVFMSLIREFIGLLRQKR